MQTLHLFAGAGGGTTVVADLAALGYDAEWLCLRASDCGAPHRRDRWWCLAERADPMRGGYDWQQVQSIDQRRIGAEADVGGDGEVQPVADAQEQRPQNRHAGSVSRRPIAERQAIEPERRGIQNVADANQHARHEGRPGNATQEPRGRHADRGGERAGIPDAILERLERQQQAGAATRTAHRPGHGRDIGGRKTESGLG